LFALVDRLKDPSTRARIKSEITFITPPDKIVFVNIKNPMIKPLMGKSLAKVAADRGSSAEETLMDLIIEDESGVGAVFFAMSEENVKKQMALPLVSFGSDGQSFAPEGIFLKSSAHPRAYGTFARVLGKYARDEKVLTLEQAVRRLSALPAENLKLDRRGVLKTGYYADVVVFDPARVQDHATYEQPHQYSTGMVHVFVNGVPVLKNGEHTGNKPGQVVRGPGWKKS
jgi:N-acyl-D-amino-acid deacylase